MKLFKFATAFALILPALALSACEEETATLDAGGGDASSGPSRPDLQRIMGLEAGKRWVFQKVGTNEIWSIEISPSSDANRFRKQALSLVWRGGVDESKPGSGFQRRTDYIQASADEVLLLGQDLLISGATQEFISYDPPVVLAKVETINKLERIAPKVTTITKTTRTNTQSSDKTTLEETHEAISLTEVVKLPSKELVARIFDRNILATGKESQREIIWASEDEGGIIKFQDTKNAQFERK
ncbi:MAG: hypothetical protein GMKNLPBB_03219 [Myxococcota bacterium]|nr:hypothetical protein [Myxococcota bacterium]